MKNIGAKIKDAKTKLEDAIGDYGSTYGSPMQSIANKYGG